MANETTNYIGEWSELADRFNLPADDASIVIEQPVSIDGKLQKFTLKDENARLAQRIKNYIRSQLNDDQFTNPSVREQLIQHLNLIAESESSQSVPIFKAMAELENDWVLANWVCFNLEELSS